MEKEKKCKKLFKSWPHRKINNKTKQNKVNKMSPRKKS